MRQIDFISIPAGTVKKAAAVMLAAYFFLLPELSFSEDPRGSQRILRAPAYSVEQFSSALWLKPSIQSSKPSPNERKTVVSTALGDVVLKLPLGFESTVGFSLFRAIQTSWSAAARVLAAANFPPEFSRGYDWNLIVHDGKPLSPSGSRMSASYCHTALMGPPSDIVVNGYRLLHPCDQSLPPEQALLTSLVHEIGHAIEFRLLGSAFSRRQRWHGEGFATWFEMRGRKLLGVYPQSANHELAYRIRESLRKEWKPYFFQGSPDDYLRSYALISDLVDLHSTEKLFASYKRMSRDNCLFEEAVERELGMSFAQWMNETRNYFSAQ